MSSTCERLREKALSAGLDSDHASAWQAHCRSCPNCRTELFVLETLDRQVQEKRCHLSRHDVGRLLAAARKHHPPRRRGFAGGAWALRCMCVFALLLAVGMSLRSDPYAVGAVAAGGSPAKTVAAATSAPKPLAPASVALAVEDAEQPAEHLCWPLSVPEGPMQERLQDLRRRVEVRRESMLDLLDSDVGSAQTGDDDQSSFLGSTTWS